MNIRTALFLAAVCSQSYMQLLGGGLFLVPEGYRMVGAFQSAGFDGKPADFGFVLESEQAAVLAFRGTNSVSDWVSDFMADQVDFTFVPGGGLTHRGFTSLYSGARKQTMELLRKLPSSKPLFVTGHSLGGALATLAALDISANTGLSAPMVYTFGSPRVGDPVFVRAFNRAIPVSFRIENENDIVPHLPPIVYRDPKAKKLYFYMHVKNEIKRSFSSGGVSGNHVIGSYFADLAREDPDFAAAMCGVPPGWCPAWNAPSVHS
ncbi:lipase [Paenibacillus beijingensis]|uniref:Lipase n=2 Tax=Paenibacillus beijingensis TaxID=1126833 RepID=A0A0D5NS86_9BACL|nr:lipase [Paenibacillus beijingensis]